MIVNVGLRRSVGAVRAVFSNSLQSSLVPQWGLGSTTPTFTRATTAYVADWESLLKPVLSGEARFTGARRVWNSIQATSEVLTSWSADATATVTAGQTDPLGGSTAYKIANVTAGEGIFKATSQPANGTGTWSVWLKGAVGGEVVRIGRNASPDVTITTSWARYSVNGTHADAFAVIRTQGANATVFAWRAMAEEVTGQSNQNPSEYVSVGVLSAPYHGANVDGVKYFTTLNGNTVASNVVTEATGEAIDSTTSKFGVLGGIAGDYFSTPDIAAWTLDSDVDIQAKVSFADWTPAASGGYNICSHYSAISNQRGWLFNLNGGSAGTLSWRQCPDGTGVSEEVKSSSVATGFADGAMHWVRVTKEKTSGNVKFYTGVEAANGTVTWTQLGSTQTLTASLATFNSTTALSVGAATAGGTSMASGKFARVIIKSSIDGTTVADFNPNTFASGTTWTSATTGEVWTINGNAKVFGGSGTSSIAAPWDAYGPFGYFAEGARTNIVTQSQTLGTTWTVSGLAAISADQYVAPDGTTTMDKATCLAGNSQHYLQQSGLTVSSTAYTMSFYARYVDHRWIVAGPNDGTGFYASFDLLNGVVGALAAGTTSTISSLGGGVYRCTVTATLTATAAAVVLLGLNTSDAAAFQTWNAAGTEDVGLWGAQLEAASFASTYIPTTTVSVTRNGDVLSYPLAGNLDPTQFTTYAETTMEWTTEALAAIAYLIGDAGGNSSAMHAANATRLLSYYDQTAVRSGNAITGTPSTIVKLASKASGAAGNTYINGTASASLGFDGNLTFTGALGVGQANSSSQWCGTIRNMRIYSRALSDAQLISMTT